MSRLGKMDTKRGRGCFLGSDNLGWSSSFIAFFLVGFMIYSIWIIIFLGGYAVYPIFRRTQSAWSIWFIGSFFLLGKIFPDGWIGELKIYHDISNTGWSIWVNLPCNLQHGGMNIGPLGLYSTIWATCLSMFIHFLEAVLMRVLWHQWNKDLGLGQADDQDIKRKNFPLGISLGPSLDYSWLLMIYPLVI